jgi:hypothetical protein
MHADDLTPAAAIHALGQGRPALDKAIGIGQLSRLGVLRRLGVRSRCKACNKEHGGDERRSGSNRIRHSETSVQKDLRFGSSLALAGGMFAGFSSVGVRHIPRVALSKDTPIIMHAKELPFPELARNRLPAVMVSYAPDTI